MPRHMRGRPLFGGSTHYQSLKEHVDEGGTVALLTLADDYAENEQQEYYTADELSDHYDDFSLVPLFVLSEGDVEVVSEMDQFRLRPGDRLLALLSPEANEPSPLGGPGPTDGDASPVEESIFEVVDSQEEVDAESAQ